MRILRRFVASLSTSLLCAVSLSSWLSGCGGTPEAVKAPKAAQVVWGSHEENSEPAEVAASEPRRAPAVEVDLDAPAQGKPAASEAPTKAKPAPAAEVSPEPVAEVEAPAPEPPAVAEPTPLPALDKEIRAAVGKQKGNAKKPPARKSASKTTPTKQPAAKKSEAAAPVASTYTGPNPCAAAHFSVPRVRDACAKGGRAAAKGVMRDAIGKALASGATLKCASCHVDQQSYTLKPDAVAQLERWLAR